MIRMLHHLSATGGTVMSKAIAAQPEAVLLSEVGPFIGRPKFLPFDPLLHYLGQMERGKLREQRIRQAFTQRIKHCYQFATEDATALVLRDYAHHDFLGARARDTGSVSDMVNRLEIPACPIVTLRHPVDSWLSLVKNNWNQHVPTFNDYCERYLAFLDAYEGAPVIKYEDFVADSEKVVAEMCGIFEITYDPTWVGRWQDVTLTGDSGRKTETISLRPRREMTLAEAREMEVSPAFAAFAERAGYRRDFAAEAVEIADEVLDPDPSDNAARRSRMVFAAIAKGEEPPARPEKAAPTDDDARAQRMRERREARAHRPAQSA